MVLANSSCPSARLRTSSASRQSISLPAWRACVWAIASAAGMPRVRLLCTATSSSVARGCQTGVSTIGVRQASRASSRLSRSRPSRDATSSSAGVNAGVAGPTTNFDARPARATAASAVVLSSPCPAAMNAAAIGTRRSASGQEGRGSTSHSSRRSGGSAASRDRARPCATVRATRPSSTASPAAPWPSQALGGGETPWCSHRSAYHCQASTAASSVGNVPADPATVSSSGSPAITPNP